MNKGKIFALLIEDNPGDARLIKEMLKKAKIGNYNLIIKNTLSEGLEELFKNRVDLILLDLMLPDSSGLQTVTILLEKVIDTPIIVLTGRNDEELALKTLQLGIQDYLVKGNIDTALLERSIIYAIERHNVKIELKKKEKMVRDALFHTKFYEDIFIHNINNTFQGILSATELCNMQINKLNSNKNIKDILDIIIEQILEGTNLISNIRKLTQIEDEKIKIEPIDVKAILSKAIENLKNNFFNHSIDIKIISPSTSLFIQANNFLSDVFEKEDSLFYNTLLGENLLRYYFPLIKKEGKCIAFILETRRHLSRKEVSTIIEEKGNMLLALNNVFIFEKEREKALTNVLETEEAERLSFLQKQNAKLKGTFKEIQRVQDDLLKKERKASIVQITLSLDSEISNPLTNILIPLQYLLTKLKGDEPLKEKRLTSIMEIIESESKKIKTILEQLRKLIEKWGKRGVLDERIMKSIETDFSRIVDDGKTEKD